MTVASRLIFMCFVTAVTALRALPAVAEPYDHIAPNPDWTPGAVASSDSAEVCRPGYGENPKATAQKLRAQVYQQYGINAAAKQHEIDHLIPLSLGGADEAANLWPESLVKNPWNAGAKNRLEVRLREMVCAGKLPLVQAQKEIASDWIAAYETYIGALDEVHGGQ